MGLTNKQQVFIAEYLQCWNATEAARRAGYAHPNKRGPELVVNSGISAEIEARLSELSMSANEVVKRLTDIARADIGDFFTTIDGYKEPIIDITKGDSYLIKKVKYDKDGRLEFEIHDSHAALRDLGKIHSLFTDKVEHSGKVEIDLTDWKAKQEAQRKQATEAIEDFDE